MPSRSQAQVNLSEDQTFPPSIAIVSGTIKVSGTGQRDGNPHIRWQRTDAIAVDLLVDDVS
jgi:hypothetical protein